VIKLRPAVADQLPPEVRHSPNLVVEVDVMPGGYVCSASLKARPAFSPVWSVVHDREPLPKLCTKGTRALFAAYAAAGLELDRPTTFGPILVLKLKFTRADYTRGRVVAELWLYPDGSRILDLSRKCAPTDAISAGLDLRKVSEGRGIDLDSEQQTKTNGARVLQHRAHGQPLGHELRVEVGDTGTETTEARLLDPLSCVVRGAPLPRPRAPCGPMRHSVSASPRPIAIGKERETPPCGRSCADRHEHRRHQVGDRRRCSSAATCQWFEPRGLLVGRCVLSSRCPAIGLLSQAQRTKSRTDTAEHWHRAP
jgi:hypothetical protein